MQPFPVNGLCFLMLCIVMLLGCQEAGPTMVSVSGKVTWQGQPLPTGQVVFVPEDKNVVGSSASVKNGIFSGKASAGKTRVQIFASRPATTVDNVMGQAPQEQYLPVRYNDQTTLSVEVVSQGPNQFSFDLTDAAK